MNLALEDLPWFETLLAEIDPRLHPSIRALAFREGMGRIRWEPLFRSQVQRVAEYLQDRLAELPADKRRSKRQDPHVLRGALEVVFSGRGATTGENYVSEVHVVMALASLGFRVRSDGRGLDKPQAFCDSITDFPCGAVVQQMRTTDGLAPLARETARRLAEEGRTS